MAENHQAWQKLGPGVLAVDLFNDEHKGEIYISNNEDHRNKLTIKLKNVSNETVLIQKGEDCHIELFFPKGVLDEEHLPEAQHFKITEWGGVGGKDLFNLDAIADKPLIDMNKLNEGTKIDMDGIRDSLAGADVTPSETATRGLRSRSVTDESDLTKMVKESNRIKQEALEEIKSIKGNQQMMRSPILQQGLTKFSGLFEKLVDLSTQVDKSLEELFDLNKRVEKGREDAKEEIFKYIQEELGNGIEAYFQSMEGQNLFNQNVDMTMKDLLKGFEGLQLSDELTAQLAKPKEEVANWDIQVIVQEDGVVIKITKTGEDTIKLDSGDYLNIEIANVKPLGDGGSRNSGFELRYPNIKIENAENGDQLNRFSQAQIGIVNRRGQKNAALQLSIVEGQQVLNDGATPNKIAMRLMNTGQESIYLKNATFGLTYEVQLEGEEEAYALTDKDDVVEIRMTNSQGKAVTNAENNSEGANTFNNKVEAGQNPNYEFVVAENQDFELKSGDYWMITIDNLKTGIAAGFANLRLNYKNVPEYWDGSLVTTVQRTPMVYTESKVGVGVLSPDGKIHIKGDGNLMSLEGKDQSFLQYKIEDGSSAKVGFDHQQADDFSIDNPSGNINLKTNDQILLNSEVPFQFKRFHIMRTMTNTDYLSKDWNAAIVGWHIEEIDFAPGKGSETLRMVIGDNGSWHIHSERKIDGAYDELSVTVDVMFVTKRMSTLVNWQ
jgi:FlaG/FlaF family flagellin (archaellin)